MAKLEEVNTFAQQTEDIRLKGPKEMVDYKEYERLGISRVSRTKKLQ